MPVPCSTIRPTCRMVAQLEEELVHLKGGGQGLNQAGGLDGACSEMGRAGQGMHTGQLSEEMEAPGRGLTV